MLMHPKGYTTQPEKNQKNHFENKNRKKTIKPYRIEFRSLINRVPRASDYEQRT
jgi:hypothetical protein